MKPWISIALCLGLVTVPAHATNLQCSDVPPLFGVYAMHHYGMKSLDQGELRERTVSRFVNALDPARTLLLEHEAARLRQELHPVFDTMRRGDCALLTNAARKLATRADGDVKLVRKILTSPGYRLDESVQLALDPDKRGNAKTPAERTALLTKMIHFQMSNYLMTGMSIEAAKKQLIHRYELAAKRLKQRQVNGKLPEMYAEAFAVSLDPHSMFMSADTLADFQIQMRLSLEGIGAVLSSRDGLTSIESLVPGGQAEQVNRLQPKDKIIAVAQEGKEPVSTIDMELREVVKMIRGKKGTKVTLTILREGAKNKTMDVTIVRDKIDVKEQAAKITYETRKVGKRTVKVGVLDLPSFYGDGKEGGRSSYSDVKRLLGEAAKQRVQGIVVDLSRNGGGLLDDAVRICGLFIHNGAVVAVKDGAGEVQVLADTDDDVAYAGPLVVLTSPASASASEILAGALKDYGRAVIVGAEHTFGKGTVQVLMPLPNDLGAVKVTTAMFFLPGGASTQQRGVPCDIRVPSPLDGFDMGDKLLDYSLPPQSMEPFLAVDANTVTGAKHWRPIDDSMVAALATKSKARVTADKEFAKIRKFNNDAARNNGEVKLSEMRKTAREMGGDDAPNKMRELERAVVNEGVDIVVDLIKTSEGTRSTSKAR